MASTSYTATATGAVAPRVDAASGTTTGSPVITDTHAVATDVGKPVSGAGIPAGAYVIAVSVGVNLTMSQNATATASVSVSVGAGPVDAGAGKVFRNYSLKAFGAADCVVALETSPDGTTWTEQDRVTGPNWAYVAMHHSRRQARANVINLGAAAGPVGAVLSYSV